MIKSICRSVNRVIVSRIKEKVGIVVPDEYEADTLQDLLNVVYRVSPAA